MQPSPLKRRSPREAGLSKGAAFGDGLHRDDTALSRERAWQLLLHAADVLTCAAGVILSEGRISRAGREVLTYTAIRLRELREVLR